MRLTTCEYDRGPFRGQVELVQLVAGSAEDARLLARLIAVLRADPDGDAGAAVRRLVEWVTEQHELGERSCS